MIRRPTGTLSFVRQHAAALRCVLVVACLVLSSLDASAQAVIGVGSAGEPGKLPHVWLALKQEEEGDCCIVHLPPRETVGEDGKVHGAPSGTVRVAARIKAMPEMLASVGPEVFMLFDLAPGAKAREVWSLVARPAGIGDLWRYEPDGRLTPRPSLPASYDPEIFLGAGGRVFIIARDQARTPVFLVLHENAWAPLPLPDDVAAALRLGYQNVEAYQIATGFVLAIGKGDATIGWLAQVGGDRSKLPALAWSNLPPGSVNSNDHGGQFSAGERPIRWRRDAETIRLEGGIGTQFHPLASLADISEHAAILPGGPSRIFAAWSEPIPPDPRSRVQKQRYKLALAEVSPDTGQVFFSGPPKGASPISADQFRFLGVGMVALTAAVLVFVLRSSGRDEAVHLDPDMSLAEPGRRMIAFAFDVTLALIAACRLLHVDLATILEPETILAAGGPLFLLTLAGGFFFSVACELAFGKTPGKFLTGCEVVGLNRAPGAGEATGRPRLWQVVARNLIKWGLPPVSGMALLDPTSRHQGERLTRTAVVVRADPEDED